MRPRIPLGVRAAEGRPRLRRPRRLRSLGVGPGPPKQDDPRNAGAAPKQTAHERKRAAPSTGAAIEGSPTDAEQATRSNGPRFAAWLDRGLGECKKYGGNISVPVVPTNLRTQAPQHKNLRAARAAVRAFVLNRRRGPARLASKPIIKKTAIIRRPEGAPTGLVGLKGQESTGRPSRAQVQLNLRLLVVVDRRRLRMRRCWRGRHRCRTCR